MQNTIDGRLFQPAILPPGPIEAAESRQPRKLEDEFLSAMLAMMHKRGLLSPEEEADVKTWVLARMAANKRAEAVLERARLRVRERVIAEWEAAKAAVREQQEKINAHNDETRALTTALNRRKDEQALALGELHSAQADRKTLSRFAAKRAVEKADALVRECERKADRANEAAMNVQAQINHRNLVEMKPLVERLNELIADEARLDHYVTGKSYTSPEGIVVPATAPI